jgi:ABC-2 type transport system permease protein
MSTSSVQEAAAERAPVRYEQLGRPILGPRALSDDWTRFWHLTKNIAVMQWKTRFFGSALGYVWQLVRPLMLFGVLYLFFTVVAHVGGAGPSNRFYGTQLLASIVLYTFFQEATMGAVRCVVDNEALVRKIQFPRLVIPLSTVLLATFNLSLNLIVVLIFGLIQGVRPMLSWLEFPLIILLLVILATGLAMVLSALFVYLRDLQPIWEVVLQVLFYASPVIVPLAEIEQKLGPAHHWLVRVYMSNPIAVVLQQFRHAMINHFAIGASAAIGGGVYLAIPIGGSFVILAIGFWVFNRTAPRVAEDL